MTFCDEGSGYGQLPSAIKSFQRTIRRYFHTRLHAWSNFQTNDRLFSFFENASQKYDEKHDDRWHVRIITMLVRKS